MHSQPCLIFASKAKNLAIEWEFLLFSLAECLQENINDRISKCVYLGSLGIKYKEVFYYSRNVQGAQVSTGIAAVEGILAMTLCQCK